MGRRPRLLHSLRATLALPMVLAGGAATPSVVADPAVAPQDFSAFAYDLDLTIDREQRRITGRETIRLRATGERLATIAFPRNGLEIRSVTSAQGEPLPFTAGDQIEIRLPAPLARGRETAIALAYTALEPKGVAFHADAIYSAFHTCHWMVCRDRPDDKATLWLAVTVPDGLTLVANGAPIAAPKRQAVQAAPRREVWEESVPSSPYLFGFALGRFSRTARTHRGVTLEYFASSAPGDDPTRLARIFADNDRMLDFFVEKAGRPLPRAFYRQVVVDGDAAQEMSSFSVLGRETLEARLTNPTEDWLIAHEMAHQFWGNLITCRDWSHLWLDEGLTVFMVAAYKERRWGRPAYERERALAQARHQVAVDARFDVPLTFAGEYPSLRLKRAITYSKGALFLMRLREVVGERAFWAALAKYTRRFAGRTAVTQDLEKILAAETTIDLAPLFDEWAYGRSPAR